MRVQLDVVTSFPRQPLEWLLPIFLDCNIAEFVLVVGVVEKDYHLKQRMLYIDSRHVNRISHNDRSDHNFRH